MKIRQRCFFTISSKTQIKKEDAAMIRQARNFFGRFGTLAAVILTVLVVFGCGGGGGSSSDGGNGGGGGGSTSPEISLSPSQLAFGNVVANTQGLRSADRSVQVTNLGTANLSLGQIAQANPLAAPFEIFDDNCSRVSLAPNASCSVVVRFKPTDLTSAAYTDSFDIPSNDADEPSLTVNVAGNGQGLNVTINKVDTSGFPNSIRLIVSVTDGDNDPLTSLNAVNFALSEEGVSQGFTLNPTKVDTPVSVALNLDYSRSIQPFITEVQNTAKSFLTTLTDPADEASVIKFASTVYEASDFLPVQTSIATLNAAIDAAYPDSTDGTLLYDAVYFSIQNTNNNDRLAGVVVSDGDDQGSTQTLESVIDSAQTKQVILFTIALGNVLETEPMQRMAVETGGQYFETPNAGGLQSIYNQISQILSNQYEITFTTSQAAGTVNDIQVVVRSGPLNGEDTEAVTY
jgi:VWFA-related protein